MPLLIAAAAVLASLVVVLALTPLTLFLRYRSAVVRRQARGWIATLNVVGLSVSALLLLTTATVASHWFPAALRFTLGGLAGGAALGLVGLAATRWEEGPRALHFTPSRALVLLVTLVILGRLGYGVWRAWEAWHAQAGSWVVAFGPAPSLAAGGVVIGYFLSYWLGVRRRLRRFEARY